MREGIPLSNSLHVRGPAPQHPPGSVSALDPFLTPHDHTGAAEPERSCSRPRGSNRAGPSSSTAPAPVSVTALVSVPPGPGATLAVPALARPHRRRDTSCRPAGRRIAPRRRLKRPTAHAPEKAERRPRRQPYSPTPRGADRLTRQRSTKRPHSANSRKRPEIGIFRRRPRSKIALEPF